MRKQSSKAANTFDAFLQVNALELEARALARDHTHSRETLMQSSAALIGKTISRYHVLEQLGLGGMGGRVQAKDTRLGRFVALKLLIADPQAQNPDNLQRFEWEACAGTVKLSGCARMRFWMSVRQPVPWPSVPERDHL